MKKKRFFKCLSVFSLLLALVLVFSSCAGLGSSLNNIKDGILDIFDESGKKPGGADAVQNGDLTLTVKYVNGVAKLSWNEISGADTYTVYKNGLPQANVEFTSTEAKDGDQVHIVASVDGKDLVRSNTVTLLQYPMPEVSGSYGNITIKNNSIGLTSYVVSGEGGVLISSGSIESGKTKVISFSGSDHGVVTVTALSSGNEGLISELKQITFEPGTVIHSLSAPTISVSYSNGMATVSHSAVSGASGYKYYLNGVEVDTHVFTADNCDNGDIVYVRAYNENVTSAESNSIILKKLSTQPSIGGSYSHIYVSSNLTGVTTYIMCEDEGTDNVAFDWHVIGMINGEAELYTGGKNDILMYYAYNSLDGWINSDTTVAVFEETVSTLKAPEIVANYTGGIATLTYSPVEGATGYQVYKNNNAVATNVFTAGNASHGDTVYVKAYNSNTYSSRSNVLSLNVLDEPSAAFTDGEYTTVIVTSNANDATCNVIVTDSDNDANILTDSFITGSKSYSVDTDHPNQTWSAFNSKEGYINSNTVTIEVGAFLPAPVISIAYSDGKASVTHSTINGADGYYVYKNGARIDTLTFDAENCSDGDVITVKAYNVQGLVSAASNSVIINKLSVPSISGQYNYVTVTRNANSATCYVVLSDEGTDDVSFESSFTTSTKSFEVYGGNDIQTWSAYNRMSGFVDSDTVSVVYEPSMSAPTVSVSYADGEATISYTTVKGADTYTVYKNGVEVETLKFYASNCKNGDVITVIARNAHMSSSSSNSITLKKVVTPTISGKYNHVYIAANDSSVTTYVMLEDEGVDGTAFDWRVVGMIDGEAEVYASGADDIQTWSVYNAKDGYISSDVVVVTYEPYLAASVASLSYDGGVATLSYTPVAGADGYRILKNGSEITTTTFNANNCENGDSIYVEAYTDEGLVSTSNTIIIKKCPEPSISGQ